MATHHWRPLPLSPPRIPCCASSDCIYIYEGPILHRLHYLYLHRFALIFVYTAAPQTYPDVLCVRSCRHWQDLGYLIIYVSARPDMQQKKVVTWLAQHNFPHGMVSFIDGLSAEPLRQKANYLKQLRNEVCMAQTKLRICCLKLPVIFCSSNFRRLLRKI